jgi:hypothetical protein
LGARAEPSPEPPPPEPLVVVVDRNSPIQDISLDELRALFQGYGLPQLRATNIELVYLRGEAEDRFNLAVLGLPSRKVREYWLKKVFQGEGDARTHCRDPAAVIARVAGNQAAVGFVPAGAVSHQVQALTIAGRGPAAPDYLLR